MKKITLPKIQDPRGNLTFFQNRSQIPFDIQRTYWIYDVPGGEERGGHAFRTTHEVIIALSGSFDVVIDDGESISIQTLNRSYFGIYIPPYTWRKINNFSTNAVALIVSSTSYDEADYIRDYNLFKEIIESEK
jgi:oxalate decarboxylase/phosphoglucose isomerase-like protein (cupin superfamily)